MFPTLFLGEKWAARSAFLSRWGARAALAVGGYAAWTLFATNPVVAVFAGLTALSSLKILHETKVYENDMKVLKIALQNRLREGYAKTQPSEIRGTTAIEKHVSEIIVCFNKILVDLYGLFIGSFGIS